MLKPIRESELREAITRVLDGDNNKAAAPVKPQFAGNGAGDAGTVLRILVAEDNPVNQRLITRLLEKRGHRTVMAADGREAES